MMQQNWIPPQPGNLTSPQNAGTSPQSLSRLLRIIYILYSIEAGLFLMWLPWTSFWDTNYLTYLYPRIPAVISNPFFKGAVLGLGIVNILIGIREVVHFRKNAKGPFYR